MKNTTDYSDEFSTLKELHEDNIGRKFTDEEFNEIFSIAEKASKDLAKHADHFQNDMLGLLMTLDEATHKWEKEKLVRSVKGNPKQEIKKMIADLEKVIDYYANDKNANWGTVGTLANIHEALGKQLYIHYDEHLGYSRSIEEGLKRHSEAAKNLLLQAGEEVKNIDAENHLSDLAKWKKFFDDLMEGFHGALYKIKSDEKLTPEIKKKLEEIFSVSQSHAVSAWAAELIEGRREITEEDLKSIEERYKVVERIKKEEGEEKKSVVVSINDWKEISVLTNPVDYDTAFEMRKEFQKKFGGEHQIIDAIPYEKGDSFSNGAERIEITKVAVTKLKGDWIWEIVFSRHESNGKWMGTYTMEVEEFKEILAERKFEREEEKNSPAEEKEKSPIAKLRQEAIDLARKLGDEKLVEYLKETPMRNIHRRISALREEVEKMQRKPVKPKAMKPTLKKKSPRKH
ncbi:MAG: hypothetical protein HY063_08960 [Bacteroidetes bacterium]|nr:hypothetical protein [Bacteroidota bacterium]